MFPRSVLFGSLAAAIAAAAVACSHTESPKVRSAAGDIAAPDSAPKATATPQSLTPNELGRIPVFEYHLIVDKNGLYERTVEGLHNDLETMYSRGYRPINITDMLDKKIDLPAGQSPVVLVFDDASPSQFRYIEKNGQLEIDPTSAVGILTAFNKQHPDWKNRAVFCMLPAAQAGRSFFGDRNIEGQKTEWRYKKVKFLADQGFELCNHTLYHARLDRAGSMVQEFIARGNMAIDSAVPGYKVRTMALPLGMWPKDHDLAHRGSWRDKKGNVITYTNEAILEVAGGPSRSPFDPQFNPLSIPRVQVIGDSAVSRTLTSMEKHGQRYVSDGDPTKVAKPVATAAAKN